MDKIVTKCAEYLTKYVNKHWIALAIGVGGIALIFIITLILSATTGDFIRFRRVCKLIGSGRTEDGMKKLKGGTRELIAEKPAGLSFDKLVFAPYGYSHMRAFKQVVFFATLVFGLVAGMLSIVIDKKLSANVATNVIITVLSGSVLTIISMIVSAAFYKGAVKRYYKMSDAINENIILGEPAVEADDLLPTTVLLCEKINEASEKKENSFEVLNQLYSLLKQESKKPQSAANSEKLKEASALLNSIILPQN